MNPWIVECYKIINFMYIKYTIISLILVFALKNRMYHLTLLYTIGVNYKIII